MKLKTWLFTALLLITFTSCNNDGYSIGDFGISWATVKTLGENAEGGYYLDSDRYGSLWISSNRVLSFKPAEGERVIAYFNPLTDDYNGYNMAVALNALSPVPTKSIISADDANTEDLGNDPMVILQGNMWVAGGYMNIVYRTTFPETKPHTINLLYDAADNEIGSAQGRVRAWALV